MPDPNTRRRYWCSPGGYAAVVALLLLSFVVAGTAAGLMWAWLS